MTCQGFFTNPERLITTCRWLIATILPMTEGMGELNSWVLGTSWSALKGGGLGALEDG